MKPWFHCNFKSWLYQIGFIREYGGTKRLKPSSDRYIKKTAIEP